MKTRWILPLILSLAILGMFPSTVFADGIIIPQPPICIQPVPCVQGSCPPVPPCPPPLPHPNPQLDIRYHHVTVKIDNQLAVTHVDQVFYNPNDWPVEGEYIFPLPLDAAVSGFTLWVDGQPVKGEVLNADQARQKYEEIVRSQRDPALLEYAGRGAVQAHIFPIPAQGERRIELEYSQALTAENGLVRYVYPLNTEKFSASPLESVSISVDIRSTQPIRAVYSPTHTISVDRPAEGHAIAGYEASNVLPDSDFALYYSIGENEAFHLLTYRDSADPTDPDGFFLLLLAPRPEVSTQVVPKDVILALDRSGSMDGEKFRQAQAALKFVLGHLNPQDRFGLITFSTTVETYASGLRPADEASQAAAWVDRLSAQGSTDLNRALLEAASMAEKERPTYLIFLTDGLPTEGVTDRQQILDNFSAAAGENLRLFPFGVGYDVDTILLDTLAQEHHGASTYVRPGDALDETLSSFYARISSPVLTNLKLDYGGLAVYDMYPDPLPDLFLGSQIVAVGRYREGGTVTVTLSGEANGMTQTFRFPEQAFTTDSRAADESTLSALPRLWATRKIGALLSKVRLQGPDSETIQQIVSLSIRYGIVTPYTSYLVTEPLALGAEAQQRIADQTLQNLQSQPAPQASGQAAVNKAAAEGGLGGASAPAEVPVESASQVRVVGARTFVLSNGVWTDTAFDPQTMAPQKAAFLSKDYFALAATSPDLAAALALGERVIALSGGIAYEVIAEASPAPATPLVLPATQAPGPQPTVVSPLPASTDAPIIAPADAATVVPAAGSPQPGVGYVWLGALLPLGLVVFVILRRVGRK